MVMMQVKEEKEYPAWVMVEVKEEESPAWEVHCQLEGEDLQEEER